MGLQETKIDANDRTLREILEKQKFTIDYFQREYMWEKKHIEQLIADLESSFLNNYDEKHEPEEVANYSSYYLGPVVMSSKDGNKSIIDGQQRLTSLTLLLIYLNNLQKNMDEKVDVADLIYSEKFRKKTFNMQVPEREECLNALFNSETYNYTGNNESVINLVNRYEDIIQLFPESLKNNTLPFFIDWLLEKIILVEIIAYSEENAYTIFETMNDRGLNLTPSEMLKGYLLSKIKDDERRNKVNKLWKEKIIQFRQYSKEEDLEFFKTWLRGKFAQSIRQSSKGAVNEDFEKVGTRFHTWVKDNQSNLNLSKGSSCYDFIKDDFKFYADLYIKILETKNTFTPGYEFIYYMDSFSIASSLSMPMLFAPIRKNDNEEIVRIKLQIVAKFIESFTVNRMINYRTISQSSIRYTIYSIVREIRDKSIEDLILYFIDKINNFEETFDGMLKFRMHGQNKRFIHYLLARITTFVDTHIGKSNIFVDYMNFGDKKKYEIEHIWSDSFERHIDEFDQRDEFLHYRNFIGDLVLLPNGTNQSFNDDTYSEKIKHYIRENSLAASLNVDYYEKNPNFKNAMKNMNIEFKGYTEYKKENLVERQNLYTNICKSIWSSSSFDEFTKE